MTSQAEPTRADLYSRVTSRIVADLEQGVCQWRPKFPHLWRRKIPQLAGSAISRMRDRRLRVLAAGLGASASAVFGLPARFA